MLGHRAAARELFDQTFLRDLVTRHERGYGNHAERLWSLVNLELWQRLFLDGESVADVTKEIEKFLGRGSERSPVPVSA